MSFFIGIAGPWILLMVLGLLATNRELELTPSAVEQGWVSRLGNLLRERDVVPSAARVLRPDTIETTAASVPPTVPETPAAPPAPSKAPAVLRDEVAPDLAMAEPEPRPLKAPPTKRRARARVYETPDGQPS